MKFPSLLRTRTSRVIALCVVAAGLTLEFAGNVHSGKGQVVDSKTGLPMAGVVMLFDCKTSSGLEGWRTLRSVSAETNAKGVFRFTLWDLRGCDIGSLSAYKKGYVNLTGSRLIWIAGSVDGSIFEMAPEADANLRRLEIMHTATVKNADNANTSPFESTRAEYHWVYFRFIDSKPLARTPDEKAFVVENYCARLRDLYKALSPEQRIELAKEKEMVRTRMPVNWHAIDHAGEVIAYCKNGGP
jgi:hypothetical protein